MLRNPATLKKKMAYMPIIKARLASARASRVPSPPKAAPQTNSDPSVGTLTVSEENAGKAAMAEMRAEATDHARFLAKEKAREAEGKKDQPPGFSLEKPVEGEVKVKTESPAIKAEQGSGRTSRPECLIKQKPSNQ